MQQSWKLNALMTWACSLAASAFCASLTAKTVPPAEMRMPLAHYVRLVSWQICACACNDAGQKLDLQGLVWRQPLGRCTVLR